MIPQVTKVISDTSMKLGEIVPEEYAEVSTAQSVVSRVTFRSFLLFPQQRLKERRKNVAEAKQQIRFACFFFVFSPCFFCPMP